MNVKIIFPILLFFWLSGIFCISLLPNPSKVIPFYNAAGESALHFIAFFVLFFLLYYSFPPENKNFVFKIAASAIFTILFSTAKEIGQLFVPSRMFALSDFFIDCLGGGVGALLLGFFSDKK